MADCLWEKWNKITPVLIAKIQIKPLNKAKIH